MLVSMDMPQSTFLTKEEEEKKEEGGAAGTTITRVTTQTNRSDHSTPSKGQFGGESSDDDPSTTMTMTMTTTTGLSSGSHTSWTATDTSKSTGSSTTDGTKLPSDHLAGRIDNRLTAPISSATSHFTATPVRFHHPPLRTVERDRIVQWYQQQRCNSAATVLVVTGPTGCGKTTLLQEALPSSLAPPHPDHHDPFVIRGAFQVLSHPDPYRAYILAMTDFSCQVRARFCHQDNNNNNNNESSMIGSMRRAVKDACGDEIQVLLQMIPSLSVIVNATGSTNNSSTISTDTSSEDFNGPTDTSNGDNVQNEIVPVPSSAPQKSHAPLRPLDDTQRFIFVFQKFLRAICSVAPTVVLVLDDMHYADECSIDVLCRILTDSIPGFLVALTYNGTDWLSDNAHQVPTSYFAQEIRNLDRSHNSDGSIHIQTISIGNFDEEQLQNFLTGLLQQSSLFDLQVDQNFSALVMEHTLGNLYHIIDFLHWLEYHQLLTTNGPSNGASSRYIYWTWNIDDIYRVVNQLLPQTNGKDNSKVPQLFYSCIKLEKVPIDVMEILKVAACLGNSRINVTMIEHVVGYPISTLVLDAVEMGILVQLYDGIEGPQYAFVHENVQMLVYHRIPEDDLELFHLEIGRRLWRRFHDEELDQNIFVVLSHLRIGRRLIGRSSERYKIAALCLHAGRKAAKSSSFRVSLIDLRLGIELLGDRGWRDEYNLTLMLYNATAELEVCNANYERMEYLVMEILQHSRCADDTIPARTTQVYALCVSDRQHEGLDRGIRLMSDLGFAFPAHFSLWALRNEVKSVLSLLKGKTNEYLKRLPDINDTTVLSAMHVLNMLYLHAVLVRPRLAAFVSLKMMKLTLTYGLCFISPLAFSTFGMLCAKIYPKPDNAFRYGELGLELLDKFQVREYLPRIYAAYYACIFPWKYHLPESLDYLIMAERVGMQTGDVEFACLCANLWGYIATDSDVPLDEVEIHWLNFQNTMKSRRQTSSLQMSVSCLQAVQYLQGKDVDLTETEKLLKYSIENKIVLKTANIRWWEAKTAFLFNDLHRADELAHVANFSKNQHTIPPTSELVQTAFLNGMIALAMASLLQQQQPQQQRRRHSDGGEKSVSPRPRRTRRQYIAEGQRMIRFLQKYVLWAPINYHAQQVLLKAELAAVKGRTEEAMQHYECAIALSQVTRHRFVQGLAHERAGWYCWSVQRHPPTLARKYLLAALSVYEEWKAYRKVDHLRAEMTRMKLLDPGADGIDAE